MSRRFVCPRCNYKVAHVFRTTVIRQSLIIRPGDEVRSVMEALAEGYRLGGEVRETEWEDAFYCPVCFFRAVDLSEFRTEEVEGTEEQAMAVEGGSGEEAPEQGIVITGGCGEVEVEVEEPDEDEVYEDMPEEQEEPKAITMNKGWVTLDDFIVQTAKGDEGSPTREEAPREEEAEADAQPSQTSDDGHEEQATDEQGGSDQPHITSDAGMGLQVSGEQAVVDLLKKKESKDMKVIRETIEWWAKKHWFTVVDVQEMMDSFTRAIVTVRTDRMPLYLFMLEELHFELREVGFSVLFIKPVGENLAEIWIGFRKEART